VTRQQVQQEQEARRQEHIAMEEAAKPRFVFMTQTYHESMGVHRYHINVQNEGNTAVSVMGFLDMIEGTFPDGLAKRTVINAPVIQARGGMSSMHLELQIESPEKLKAKLLIEYQNKNGRAGTCVYSVTKSLTPGQLAFQVIST
jgi:hypothetical protein